MSITKYDAELTAPDGTSVGITPTVNQNTMIAIGFVEIEVYGKNGGTWELVGTLSSTNKVVFVPFTTYSEVYFKSNTGSAETVRVFYFTDSIAKAAAPTPTSVSDIGDLPSFSSADAGKVLSVDGSGNLVWIAR